MTRIDWDCWNFQEQDHTPEQVERFDITSEEFPCILEIPVDAPLYYESYDCACKVIKDDLVVSADGYCFYVEASSWLDGVFIAIELGPTLCDLEY